MKWVLGLVGILLLVVGAFWFLQGINVIPVGFMAGQPQYAILGFIVAVAGAGLVAFAVRRMGRTRATGSTMARPPSENDR